MNEPAKRRARSSRSDRIEGLRRRGEFERDVLAREVSGLRGEIDRVGSRWKTAGYIAGGLAAAWTIFHKLFGRHSLSAKVGRAASAASILFGLGKAVGRARKYW